MNIKNSYVDLIGNTPLLRLHRYEKHINSYAEIVVKLENLNPLASVKDRLAYALITSMEEQGLINENTIFVEPTSGNTGIGLAFICAAKGYKLTLVMPETVSIERVQIAKALGADVILTDRTKGMKGAIAKTNEIIASHPNAIIPMQFENKANPEIHRRTTAQEILKDTDSKLDLFVAGVGTGGTITGVGEVLKKTIPSIKIVAVEPKDSPVLSGGEPGPHMIQGIGAGFVPPVLNREVIDQIITVSNEDAMETARILAKTEGVFAGISSGANLFAATQLALKIENQGKRIVVIVCDTGERYLSTPLYQHHV